MIGIENVDSRLEDASDDELCTVMLLEDELAEQVP
jgi:hypothetical protein